MKVLKKLMVTLVAVSMLAEMMPVSAFATVDLADASLVQEDADVADICAQVM